MANWKVEVKELADTITFMVPANEGVGNFISILQAYHSPVPRYDGNLHDLVFNVSYVPDPDELIDIDELEELPIEDVNEKKEDE